MTASSRFPFPPAGPGSAPSLQRRRFVQGLAFAGLAGGSGLLRAPAWATPAQQPPEAVAPLGRDENILNGASCESGPRIVASHLTIASCSSFDARPALLLSLRGGRSDAALYFVIRSMMRLQLRSS